MKRIIILSDGTGNSAAKVWRTNVWRIFEALDLRSSDQIAMYDDGVGTSSFKPLALLGGAFGFGLKRNVIGLYKFLCRNYRSKNDYLDAKTQSKTETKETLCDDQIYLFGFSRGAFTVRLLMGLVLSEGLVTFNSEQELDKKARAAYRAYRTKKYKHWTLETPFRFLRNLAAAHTHNADERRVKHIRFIGVWDTVAAYGSPIDEMTRGFSQYIWPLELPDHKLSTSVDRACQALAIDEERTTFSPVLWEEPETPLPQRTQDEKISQVWFAGVHSNIGGGYPDDSLANVSLNWMMQEAAACGLRFKTAPEADPDSFRHIHAAQDKDGRLYDSRSGLGGYYRYGPRKIEDCYQPALKAGRVPKIHESALQRICIGAHLYAPVGLPLDYAVVGAESRAILPLRSDTAETKQIAGRRFSAQQSVWNVVWRRRAIYFLTVFASLYLALYPLVRESFAYQEMSTRLRIVSDTIKLLGAFLANGAARSLDGYARDPAWFLIWIGIIAALIFYSSNLKSEISSRMRRIWDENLSITRPKDESSPSRSYVLALLYWIAILAGAYIAIYPAFDWHQSLEALKAPEPINSLITRYSEWPLRWVLVAFLIFHLVHERVIEKLRTWSVYKAALLGLKLKLAPFLFAVAILFAGFGVLNHLLFNVRDSFGSFCKHNADAKGTLHNGNDGFGESRRIRIAIFDSAWTDERSLCFPTGVFATRGQKYAISVARTPAEQPWSAETPWTFWNEPAFMSGQPVSSLPWWKQPIMAIMLPFRRTLDRPWGAFIVRYGPTGTEESFLDREPPALDDDLIDDPQYKAENIPQKKDKYEKGDGEYLGEGWTATRDGEIYVYLNKPVLGIWGAETLLSKYLFPNMGVAHIDIQKK